MENNTNNPNNAFQMPASDEVWIVNYEDLDFHEEIGSGQFGRVFKAAYFGATVGVKKISKDPGQDEIMLKFIQREIEILKYVEWRIKEVRRAGRTGAFQHTKRVFTHLSHTRHSFR